MFEKAMDAFGEGRLVRDVLYDGSFRVELFCYSRDVFLSGDWDETTITHRGKMYLNGRPINHVFPKIFNLNEVPATSLSVVQERFENNYPFVVMDKVNGHLVILTHDERFDKWRITTKGSLQSEMIDEDEKVFEERGYRDSFDYLPPGITLMFESLTEYDPHTLHREQKAMYTENGEDVMVLLGGYWPDGRPMEVWELTNMSGLLGCPLVKFYSPEEIDTSNLMALFDHKGIEGYVFWFPDDDFRVKIKTHEYWQLRVKKDLTPKRLVAMYCNQGPEAMLRKLPEEYDQLLVNEVGFVADWWYMFQHVDVWHIPPWAFELYGKDLHTSELLTDAQKTYLQKVQTNGIGHPKNVDIGGSRTLRKQFLQWFMSNELAQRNLEDRLMEIVG